MKKLLVILAFVLLIQGCSKKETLQNSTELTIYMLEDNEYYDSAIRAFSTDLELNIEHFATAEELANKYAAQSAIGQAPDVVLCSPESKLDISKLIKAGSISEVGDYIDFSLGGYIEGAVKGGQFNNKQYIIPFTFDASVCVLSDKKYEELRNITLEADDFNSLAQNLLSINDFYKDSEIITLGLSITGANDTSRIGALARISGMQLIDQENNIIVTKEQFQILCEVYEALQYNSTVVFPQIAYDTLYENSAVHLSIDNPIIYARRMEMEFEAFTESGSKIYGVPSFSQESAYAATINNYGFVSSSCTNKEEAYRLLKQILDYRGDNLVDGVYVNRSKYFILLNEVKSFEKMVDYRDPTKEINVSPMSDETYQFLTSLVDRLGYVSIPNYKLEEILNRCADNYITGSKDIEQSYEELKSSLELYLNE